MISVVREREAYEAICGAESLISVFAQPWYLDLVCGGVDGWESIVILSKGTAIGAIAFPKYKKQGFTAVTNVKQWPYAQVWISYPDDMKPVSRKAREVEVLEKIVSEIPSVDRFNLKFDHTFENWLPFYWKGYSQTTYYTYILPTSELSLTNIRSHYKESVRRALKKGNKFLSVDDGNVEDLISLGQKTFMRQNMAYPNDPEKVRKVVSKCIENGSGKLYQASDQEGRVHSCIFVLSDKLMSYYMLGGSDPELRNSGAMNVLLDHAISKASEKGGDFNFEGSMVPGIERFFRTFGATQVPLLKVYKNSSFVLRAINSFKSLW